MNRLITALFVAGHLVAALAMPSDARAQAKSEAEVKLSVKGNKKDDPFTLSAKASETKLTIELDIDAGWHMYGRDTGGGVPVTLTIQDGSCFEAAGKPVIPMDKKGEITGNAKITLSLRRSKKGGSLRVTFSYMACDALMCLPPRDLQLTTSTLLPSAGKKLKLLLVTLDDKPRSQRIKTYLETQGMSCDLAKYTGLSKKLCDRYDIVIADSPNKDKVASRKAMSMRAHVMRFPQTKAPIIAIGFLGTVLLKAHKIAMASGYI